MRCIEPRCPRLPSLLIVRTPRRKAGIRRQGSDRSGLRNRDRPERDATDTQGSNGDRKVRLIACGVARCVWGDMTEDTSRRVVEVAERFADGLATQEELAEAHRAAWDDAWAVGWGGDSSVPSAAAAVAEEFSVRAAENAVKSLGPQSIHCEVIRDIVGQPFTPCEFNPAWRSAEVIALARRIYEERRFLDMPRLADALQQAGCRDATVLDHCCCSGLHTGDAGL